MVGFKNNDGNKLNSKADVLIMYCDRYYLV